MLKQLIIISSLLIATLLVYSCKDYCEMTDYESYLPLKLGNKWTYRISGNWEVVGTKVINGSIFDDILISGQDSYGTIYSHHSYYRFKNSKLIQYYSSDSIEVTIADFSLKEGEMFHQKNTGYNVTVLSDNPNEFVFYYDRPDWGDEELAVKFRIDVGILGYCATAWEECDFNDLIDYQLK